MEELKINKNSGVIIDPRLKRFIKSIHEWEDGTAYSVNMTDIEDAFWFNNKIELQEFLHRQTVERFYDKELRQGYFDYLNEQGDVLRYTIIDVTRGKITLKL